MDDAQSDFLKRKDEVNEYFKFLEVLNNDNVSLKYSSTGEIEEVAISLKLQKILIANTFLLLYNLVESTVRNSIIAIYTKIQDDEVHYHNLSDEIKKIWLHKNRKKLSDNSNDSTIEEYLKNMISEIVTNEIIILTEDDVNISGNIDAQEIRKLASELGFEASPDGRHLVEIKSKRNRLAHGEVTFHDIGKDFTYNELIIYKDNSFEHLEDVIDKIENFINDGKYKVAI